MNLSTLLLVGVKDREVDGETVKTGSVRPSLVSKTKNTILQKIKLTICFEFSLH